jgi:NADPH2:quinone reductase
MLDRTRNVFIPRPYTMHVPRTMFAAAIDRFGGPDMITGHALPVPPLDADEVMIAVDSAGVGPWDADVREGYYAPRKPHFPLVLGYDGSGIVAAVGSRVRRLKVGDEVYSYNWQNPKGGFYAEYVAVPADKVAPIPRRLDLRHSGAIPITGLTALQGIDDALDLKKGETIIIHGVSGGVGTLAVQFASLRGAGCLQRHLERKASNWYGKWALMRLSMANAPSTSTIRRAVSPRLRRRHTGARRRRRAGEMPECASARRPAGASEWHRACAEETAQHETDPLRGIARVREFERLNAAVQAAKLKVPIAECYPLTRAYKAHKPRRGSRDR